MSILTYESAPAATVKDAAAQAPKVSVKAPGEAKGFWSRVFDRMIEARRRQAEEYVARHPYLSVKVEPRR